MTTTSSNNSDNGQAISIVLVDHSERAFGEINDLLKRLRSLKYTLDWAGSFEDGLQHIESDRYDICLLDHNIDSNGGLDFLKACEKLSTRCAVILLSDGLSIDGDMAALRAGASDYLQKSRLMPGILHRAIRFALHRQSNGDSTGKLRQKISRLLRSQAVSEIASGIALDLSNLIVKIDRQFQQISENLPSKVEFNSLVREGRTLCKQAFQLSENIAVCTNPEAAVSSSSQTTLKDRKRVLVIDSNFNLLEVAKLYLEAGNLDNKCFSNPLYALEWFRQHHQEIDGVILDCVCPPISASECLTQLKAINPEVKVVICSTREDADYRKLIEQGALRFFEKPAGYPSMVSWLVEALG